MKQALSAQVFDICYSSYVGIVNPNLKRSSQKYLLLIRKTRVYISDTNNDENEFICDNTKLVHGYVKCNNIDDCGDNSDEKDCTGIHELTTCLLYISII